MKPRQFLDAARRILAGPDESDWRSAVSRAYYGAFHETIALFRSLRFRVPDDGNAHRYLSDRLQGAGEADWTLAGRRLERLREDRTDADYDLTVAFGVVWAEQIVDQADDYFDLLDDLRGDPNMLTAVAAMAAYERGRGQVTYFGP